MGALVGFLTTIFLPFSLTHGCCIGAGAIVGPTIGTALWRARHRSITQAIDVKDTEFFHRIAKNRVDASLQSPTQPVPDYYGIYIINNS